MKQHDTSPTKRAMRSLAWPASVRWFASEAAPRSAARKCLRRRYHGQQRGPIERGDYRLMAGDKLNEVLFTTRARAARSPGRMISLDVTGEISPKGSRRPSSRRSSSSVPRYLKPRGGRHRDRIGDRRVYGRRGQSSRLRRDPGRHDAPGRHGGRGFKDTAQKPTCSTARAAPTASNASRVDLMAVVKTACRRSCGWPAMTRSTAPNAPSPMSISS